MQPTRRRERKEKKSNEQEKEKKGKGEVSWDERGVLRSAFLEKGKACPECLKGFADEKHLPTTETRLIRERLLFFRTRNEPLPDAVFEQKKQEFLSKFLNDPVYEPGSTRTLISADLSKNRNKKGKRKEPHAVPKFCDLGESGNGDGTPFDYIGKNKGKAVWTAKNGCFKYRCDCSGPCSDDSCKCLKLNAAMNKMEISLKDGRLELEAPCIDMNHNALVTCGDLCGCDPGCPNRISNMIGKNRFEIFKRDSVIGFAVRTLSFIPFGEIVAEFRGEVVDDDALSPESQDWAMTLASKKPDGEGKVEEDTRTVLGSIVDIMKDIFDSQEIKAIEKNWIKEQPKGHYTFSIDPRNKGSFARFFTHGCWPNLQPLRVISNYLAIPRHRIFFYASQAISAGSELYFDYGNEFKKRLDCRCGTPLCKSDETYRNFTRKQLFKLMKTIHRHHRDIAREKAAAMAIPDITFDSDDEIESDDVIGLPSDSDNEEDLSSIASTLAPTELSSSVSSEDEGTQGEQSEGTHQGPKTPQEKEARVRSPTPTDQMKIMVLEDATASQKDATGLSTNASVVKTADVIVVSPQQDTGNTKGEKVGVQSKGQRRASAGADKEVLPTPSQDGGSQGEQQDENRPVESEPKKEHKEVVKKPKQVRKLPKLPALPLKLVKLPDGTYAYVKKTKEEMKRTLAKTQEATAPMDNATAQRKEKATASSTNTSDPNNIGETPRRPISTSATVEATAPTSEATATGPSVEEVSQTALTAADTIGSHSTVVVAIVAQDERPKPSTSSQPSVTATAPPLEETQSATIATTTSHSAIEAATVAQDEEPMDAVVSNKCIGHKGNSKAPKTHPSFEAPNDPELIIIDSDSDENEGDSTETLPREEDNRDLVLIASASPPAAKKERLLDEHTEKVKEKKEQAPPTLSRDEESPSVKEKPQSSATVVTHSTTVVAPVQKEVETDASQPSVRGSPAIETPSRHQNPEEEVPQQSATVATAHHTTEAATVAPDVAEAPKTTAPLTRAARNTVKATMSPPGGNRAAARDEPMDVDLPEIVAPEANNDDTVSGRGAPDATAPTVRDAIVIPPPDDPLTGPSRGRLVCYPLTGGDLQQHYGNGSDRRSPFGGCRERPRPEVHSEDRGGREERKRNNRGGSREREDNRDKGYRDYEAPAGPFRNPFSRYEPSSPLRNPFSRYEPSSPPRDGGYSEYCSDIGRFTDRQRSPDDYGRRCEERSRNEDRERNARGDHRRRSYIGTDFAPGRSFRSGMGGFIVRPRSLWDSEESGGREERERYEERERNDRGAVWEEYSRREEECRDEERDDWYRGRRDYDESMEREDDRDDGGHRGDEDYDDRRDDDGRDYNDYDQYGDERDYGMERDEHPAASRQQPQEHEQYKNNWENSDSEEDGEVLLPGKFYGVGWENSGAERRRLQTNACLYVRPGISTNISGIRNQDDRQNTCHSPQPKRMKQSERPKKKTTTTTARRVIAEITIDDESEEDDVVVVEPVDHSSSAPSAAAPTTRLRLSIRASSPSPNTPFPSRCA